MLLLDLTEAFGAGVTTVFTVGASGTSTVVLAGAGVVLSAALSARAVL